MISLVLSGGVGSRLWPLSREKLPKQFSPIFGESLFVQTLRRQQQLGDVVVCTGESMRALTEGAIRNNGLKVSQVFYEPQGRNTAPAIGWVCAALLQAGRGDEVLGVFPSDHWIEKRGEFAKVLQLAEACAQQGQIVTLGLKPSYAATGFGYIDCETEAFATGEGYQAFKVKAFKEKPDQKTAEQYVQAGHYSWNSGMFVFQIKTMAEAFQQYLPEMWQSLQKMAADDSNLAKDFGKLQKESIDFGIMEKAKNQVNIPCEIGWSDLGSWDDVAEAVESGKLHQKHHVLLENSRGAFTYSDQEKMICLSNVDDLIVVDTQDALLVTRKGQSQSVKQVVEQLQKTAASLTIDHVYEYRPWGHYRNLYEEPSFKTKVIQVDPGQQLSYQSHKQRTEIWVTVVGQGEVVLDDEVIRVQPGKVVEIPQGAKHRMRNTGEEPLKFVEVQLGTYFGEDDITRYQDDYNRK